MSTQGEEPVEGTEEFRDSGLDQDHVADAFEAMEAAPEGGALLEGETADSTDDADTGGDDDPDDHAPDSGADVASGGGEGQREPTTGAVGDRDGQGDGRDDDGGADDR